MGNKKRQYVFEIVKSIKCKKKLYCTYFEIFYISEIAKNRWNRIQSSICGSQICDDLSLFDLTRNSEDSHWTGNHNDDKVAVLEFELRKARETIFNLREELTQQTKTRYIDKKDFLSTKAVQWMKYLRLTGNFIMTTA